MAGNLKRNWPFIFFRVARVHEGAARLGLSSSGQPVSLTLRIVCPHLPSVMEDMDELLDDGVLNAVTRNDAMVQYESLNFLHANLHLSFHSTYVSNPDNVA